MKLWKALLFCLLLALLVPALAGADEAAGVGAAVQVEEGVDPADAPIAYGDPDDGIGGNREPSFTDPLLSSAGDSGLDDDAALAAWLDLQALLLLLQF